MFHCKKNFTFFKHKEVTELHSYMQWYLSTFSLSIHICVHICNCSYILKIFPYCNQFFEYLMRVTQHGKFIYMRVEISWECFSIYTLSLCLLNVAKKERNLTCNFDESSILKSWSCCLIWAYINLIISILIYNMDPQHGVRMLREHRHYWKLIYILVCNV